MIVIILLIFLIQQTSQDYIRSDELILNENLEIGSEIINLNNLLKPHTFNPNLQFKIVNDTNLVNYIHLEYLNSETTLIIIKKKLNFEDLCDLSVQKIEAKTITSSIVTCSHTIKIIAINENDFIEIPIQIRKINFIKKQKIKIKFQQKNLILNLTSIENSFLIEKALILSSQDSIDLKNRLDYQITSTSKLITTNLEYNNDKNFINLTVKFIDEKSLIKAYDFDLEIKLKLEAFMAPNISNLYIVEENSIQSIYLRVTELKKLNLKPLDFAQSLYSIVIENKYLAINDIVLEPRLKYASNESDIVFSLFQNEPSSGKFPFYVDADTGAIRVRSQLWTEDDDYLNKNVNKNYLFGLKATYKRLLKKSSKSNYYYDYMIPAFTKIQINVRREKMDSAIVHADIASPLISKYEILNKQSSNQTFIYYINDPIKIGSKLVFYSVEFAKAFDWNFTNLEWMYWNQADFEYKYNSSYLEISNLVELRDGQVYTTCLKYVERTRQSHGFRVLNQLNIEFRVDFDPLLFEQNEYNISLFQSDLVEQKIVKFKLRARLGSKYKQDKEENVVFRLVDSDDSHKFNLDFHSGWLSVKQVLGKSVYHLDIVAVNSNIQKTATIKCVINVDCSKVKQPKDNFVFNVFENSLAGTQIGKFQSVCTNSNFVYTLESSLNVRLCSKFDEFNCKKFHLETKNNFIKSLFKINADIGYLVNSKTLSIETFLNLIKSDYAHVYNDLNQIFESSRLSVLLRGKIKFPQGISFDYPIQIEVRNRPMIANFSPKLSLLKIDSNKSESICLYNYTMSTTSSSHISRFVKVDQNMAQFDPEFIFSHCKAKFYIDHNGCLSLKFNHIQRLCQNIDTSLNGLILNTGVYHLQFKLCFYDTNKVSCSDMYNQTIHIPFDVYNTSRVVLVEKVDVDDQIKSFNQNLASFLNRPNFRVYLVIILAVVALVGLIAVIFLVILFSGPKNDLKSLGKKALVIKNDMNFKYILNFIYLFLYFYVYFIL